MVQLPGIVADPHIADGSLIEVLKGWTPPGGIVHAVFPTRRGLLPSVRSFIDFLAARYGALAPVPSQSVPGGGS